MAATDTSRLISDPIQSKRFGTTLVVNLSSSEVPLVVSREAPMPRAALIVTHAARLMMKLSKDGGKVQTVLVTGSHVDPTLHPQFREITENIKALRDKWFPRAKLALLSDSLNLDPVEVRLTVATYDLPILRMEWGTAKTFTALTGRKSSELPQIMKHMTSLDSLIIEARFLRGDVDNTADAEMKAWLKRVSDVKPKEIHIVPPDVKNMEIKAREAPPSFNKKLPDLIAEHTAAPVKFFGNETFAA